jgi:hypothetical protein
MGQKIRLIIEELRINKINEYVASYRKNIQK